MEEETSEVFKNFLKASDQAKKLMLESDEIWDDVRPIQECQ